MIEINMTPSPWNYISRRRRPGPIFFSSVFSISILVTLIYLNKDYSGFDGFAEFSGNLFRLGTQSQNYHKESCLSREESTSYRRPTPYKPSPYLLTKLHHYEALHRRCGPDTRPYRRTINKLVKSGDRIIYNNNNGDNFSSSSSALFTTECRYMVWRGAEGLGNQMVSMVSAFLYALLTNRVLLVDFGHEMTNLFCHPFSNETTPSWTLPNNFPHRHNRYKYLKTFETLMNTPYTNHITLPPFLYVNLYSGSFNRVKYFHCDKAHNLLSQIPILVTQSDLYYTPSLFMTPLFTTELDKMFPEEKTTVFHHLGKYLFHPSNEAWRRITEYYDKHMAKADVKVGLQIRVVHSNQVTPQQVMEQILSCTIKRGVLPAPPLQFLPPNEQNGTNNLTKTDPRGTSSMAILIASLYPDYARNLTAMYTNTTTSTGEVITVHQRSSEGHQKFGNAEQNMNAWVEMYLLSLSDKLVTTGESTFGYVAKGLGGLKPWVLRKQDKETSNSVSCWRGLTVDPCFHFPPKYDCVAGKDVGLEVLTRMFQKRVRICEDRGLGLRLTDGW